MGGGLSCGFEFDLLSGEFGGFELVGLSWWV